MHKRVRGSMRRVSRLQGTCKRTARERQGNAVAALVPPVRAVFNEAPAIKSARLRLYLAARPAAVIAKSRISTEEGNEREERREMIKVLVAWKRAEIKRRCDSETRGRDTRRLILARAANALAYQGPLCPPALPEKGDLDWSAVSSRGAEVRYRVISLIRKHRNDR